MKLRINGFNNEINLDNNINVLVIEDKKCFGRIIGLINDKILGSENKELLFLKGLDEIKVTNKVQILFDLYNFDYNVKKILNKIYLILESNINKAYDLELEEKIFEIKNLIITEINELPIEFIIDDSIDYKEVLKLFNLKVDSSCYETLLEKMELMLQLFKILDLAQILVIPNLKLYFADEEILEIYKHAMYNDIKLLVIENNLQSKLTYETIYYIDENFDEFIYK